MKGVLGRIFPGVRDLVPEVLEAGRFQVGGEDVKLDLLPGEFLLFRSLGFSCPIQVVNEGEFRETLCEDMFLAHCGKSYFLESRFTGRIDWIRGRLSPIDGTRMLHLSDVGFKADVPLRIKDNDVIGPMFDKIMVDFFKGLEHLLLCNAYLNVILSELIFSVGAKWRDLPLVTSNTGRLELLSKVVRFLIANHQSDLKPRDLADGIGIPVEQLEEIIQNRQGKDVKEFIRDCRRQFSNELRLQKGEGVEGSTVSMNQTLQEDLWTI